MIDKSNALKVGNKGNMKNNIGEQISHIAFIMDGNGRWAKGRGLKRTDGHREGAKAAERVIKHCLECGIKCVSLYAFSTENWSRPKEEIDTLFGLIKRFVKNIHKSIDKDNVRVVFMGDITRFPPDIHKTFEGVRDKSADKTGGVINIGLNYGSRDEIVRAVNRAVEDGKPVTDAQFESLLYTDGLPPLDLVVRSSGEYRLSNFMMWQAAYAELFFLNTLWPDMDEKELDKVFEEFLQRNRRFGGL